MSPRSICEIMRLLFDGSIQVVGAGLPCRTREIVRLRPRAEGSERGLQIGGAASLVLERELRELLLQVQALQLHLERLVRRSVEEERRLHLTLLDVLDERLEGRMLRETHAVPQNRQNLRLHLS